MAHEEFIEMRQELESHLKESIYGAELPIPSDELLKKIVAIILGEVNLENAKEDFAYYLIGWDCLHCPECEGTGMKHTVADEEDPNCETCRGTGSI